MSAPIATLLDDETVSAVAAEVWSALVGEDEVLVPGQGPVAEGRSAWVGVEGPWSGLVVLTCSTAATDDLTRAVLQLAPAEELEDDDVDDVLRELANILGGNVKSLLPGPSTLGLPQTGTPPHPGTDVRPVGATWRGHPLTITVQGAVPASPQAPEQNPTTEVTP